MRSGRVPEHESVRVQPAAVTSAGAAVPPPAPGLRGWRFRILFSVGMSAWMLGILAAFLSTRPDTLHLVLGVAGWAIYPVVIGATFWSAFTGRSLRGMPGVAASAVLTIVAVSLVRGLGIDVYLQLFFFPAFAAARLAPDRIAVAGITTVAVLAGLTDLLGGAQPGNAAGLGVAIFFISFTVHSVGVLQQTNRDLHRARLELAAMAVAAERDRFARDLHDTLGHSLTLMALKSELASRLVATNPDRARDEMGDVAAAARSSLASVRETVSGYRHPSVEQELAAAAAALAAADIGWQVDGDVPALPPPAAGVLGWAIREGVTNVLRHSGAREVRIRFRPAVDGVTMELTDDGGGAGPEEKAAAPARGSGFGLRGLAERVAEAGGRMESGPLDPRGFRLAVTVPARGAA